MSIAICPGSFDPMTLGHLNIVRRTSRIFEKVVVLVMVNATKKTPMFTIDERVDIPTSRWTPLTGCWPSTPSATSTR